MLLGVDSEFCCHVHEYADARPSRHDSGPRTRRIDPPPIVYSPMPWFGSSLGRWWTGKAEPKPKCFGWPVPTWEGLSKDARCFCAQTHTSKLRDPLDATGLAALKGPLPQRIAELLEAEGVLV